jgi:aspartate ammonia-lyase
VPSRLEHDLLGSREVAVGALWGIATLRAIENFPLAGRPVNRGLVHAYGAVKLAAARANREAGAWSDADHGKPENGKTDQAKPEDGKPNLETRFAALCRACEEMMDGRLDEHIVVDALQGGAGTSTNMNVNEVLANRALQILGRPLGDYATLSPSDDANLHQSTNDTYPTALKVAAIHALRRLERQITALQEAFQEKEKQFAHVVKVGRTECQDAVLTTLGREMSAYAEAFSRDRWRVYKCEERLRVVNLGGTAIGTGLGAPRQYIFRATEILREITGLGLARADNLIEATQNADAFVEVSGILKALATNLMKVAGDLRLLSSGPQAGLGEIRLPARQAGSSIMPGKVNPVIPEAVTQAALRVMAHDQTIASAAAMGSLELNPFLPIIADSLLDSLDLLEAACRIFRTHCVEGIEADEVRCRRHVQSGTAVATALVETLGYEKVTELVAAAERDGVPLRQLVLDRALLTPEQFADLTSPERVTQIGSRKRMKDKG